MKTNKTTVKLNNLSIITVSDILQNHCPLLNKIANASLNCSSKIKHTHCPYIDNTTTAHKKTIPIQSVLWIHTIHKTESILISNIIRAKGAGHYTIFYLKNNSIITYCGSLLFYEKQLEHSFFIRIHRSYIINKKHIEKESYKNGTIIMSDNSIISVSPPYRKKLIAFLKAA